ncbi:hypothetical protein ACIBEF_20840 [Micromonospora sp. NPDC050795]|uniref:hypothetical protein n=1 Tax=Micromonospora sp. NPDC050795 TaxID=3364282 RepID=UPI00378CD4B6
MTRRAATNAASTATRTAVPTAAGTATRPSAVLSNAAANQWVSSSFGLVAVLCAVALIVHHRRNRTPKS